MKFRALCTDIDGTLLDSRRELSPRTIAAIRNLDKKIPVILASSRMPSAMFHLQHELDITDHPLICFNGGYVLYFADGKHKPAVLDSVFIPTEICDAIVTLSANTEIHTSLYFEDSWYAPTEDQWTEREARITKVAPIIQPNKSVLEEWNKSKKGAHKVMCMGPSEQIDVLEEDLELKFSRDLNVYRSRPTYLEIAPKVISKGTALNQILTKQFNIDSSEVIAFGDNYNDVDLLQSVGYGVAVANARDEVKAVAKEITSDSKEDGVAKIIEKYFH